MSRYRILPQAADDISEAAHFLESRQPTYGLRLLNRIRQAIESILRFPESDPKVGRELRRRRVWQFHFDVLYAQRDGKLLIVALSHHSRRPNWWRSRWKPTKDV